VLDVEPAHAEGRAEEHAGKGSIAGNDFVPVERFAAKGALDARTDCRDTGPVGSTEELNGVDLVEREGLLKRNSDARKNRGDGFFSLG